MKSPYGGRGTKKCCCCCNLDPDYTCYLIGALSIVIFCFGGILATDFNYVLDIIVYIFWVCYYLTAGLCLIFGTLHMNKRAKNAYCWMMVLGVMLIFLSMAMCGFVFMRRDHYNTFELDRDHRIALGITFGFHYTVLIVFSLYTPCIVLGNMDTYRVPPQ